MNQPNHDAAFAAMKRLSPRRHTTTAENLDQLVAEQLSHFGIKADSPFGASLAQVTKHLYESQGSLEELWRVTLDSMKRLDRSDRIAYFNAQKFLSFQLAKRVLQRVQ